MSSSGVCNQNINYGIGGEQSQVSAIYLDIFENYVINVY